MRRCFAKTCRTCLSKDAAIIHLIDLRMLHIEKLYVKYNKSLKTSIAEVSFDIEKGDCIAILGPSGCGKTTLLNVIAQQLGKKDAAISGEVIWKNQTQNPIVNMVFQEARLLPWKTVEENVSIGLEIKKLDKNEIAARTKQILELVGLNFEGKEFPRQLSIGMQQRVNFARALVCNPDLLLLDEPFSALDIKTKKVIQNEFVRIIKEKRITTIFVTHNLEEAVFMANKIVILTKGPARIKKIIENKDKMFDMREIVQLFNLNEDE